MQRRRSEADRRARQSQKLARVLRVLCLLQERRPWNLESLAQELGCSKRTIQRDLDVLQAGGIPFYYDERRCCYRIRADFKLPLLEALKPADTSGKPTSTSTLASPVLGPLTTEELTESSREAAERILSEAERLIKTLVKLSHSLRQASDPPPQARGQRAK